MLIQLLVIFMIIFSIIIVVISMLMAPDSNSFSGALVGSNDLELFKFSKERGYKKVLKYSMMFCGIVLIILGILIWYFQSNLGIVS
ncbi:preprotein translocase subunit SecG [Mycoplasmopsis maculosa]|uniref:Protein-export membrane protein SecG n=1 Tax=Mycoplasmopsis maculosa TaxID=114885 RepID=A0A449B4G3_9BACT|nr:preprotein translocase subunit SecG [Mycoplasmopsis maculosa]VEU75487.1 preprotein translocase subunit SecG [Mycoplasmopsis maculosa]